MPIFIETPSTIYCANASLREFEPPPRRTLTHPAHTKPHLDPASIFYPPCSASVSSLDDTATIQPGRPVTMPRVEASPDGPARPCGRQRPIFSVFYSHLLLYFYTFIYILKYSTHIHKTLFKNIFKNSCLTSTCTLLYKY